MKKVVLILIVVSFIAKADYLNPPDWAASMDFTHQSWDFLVDESNSLPAAPDGEPNLVNTFGVPGLIDIEYTTDWQFWMWNPYPQYLQVPPDNNGFYGGMGDTTLTFAVPNNERQLFYQKQLWIQAEYWARNDTPENYDFVIARDPNLTDVNDIELVWEVLEELDKPSGKTGRFYRLTAAARFEDQPNSEYVAFSVYRYPPDMSNLYGGASMIDQVHIDTRCISPDLIEDGIVNLRDFSVLANNYNDQNSENDFYPDGFIEFHDLDVLFKYWLVNSQQEK
jgi:hypothetical protein